MNIWFHICSKLQEVFCGGSCIGGCLCFALLGTLLHISELQIWQFLTVTFNCTWNLVEDTIWIVILLTCQKAETRILVLLFSTQAWITGARGKHWRHVIHSATPKLHSFLPFGKTVMTSCWSECKQKNKAKQDLSGKMVKSRRGYAARFGDLTCGEATALSTVDICACLTFKLLSRIH